MNRPGAYAGGRELHMYHIATVKLSRNVIVLLLQSNITSDGAQLGNPPCDRRERKRRRRTAFANPYDLLFHFPLNGASVQNMGSGGSEVGRRQPPQLVFSPLAEPLYSYQKCDLLHKTMKLIFLTWAGFHRSGREEAAAIIPPLVTSGRAHRFGWSGRMSGNGQVAAIVLLLRHPMPSVLRLLDGRSFN
jgi:hypothetical protein